MSDLAEGPKRSCQRCTLGEPVVDCLVCDFLRQFPEMPFVMMAVVHRSPSSPRQRRPSIGWPFVGALGLGSAVSEIALLFGAGWLTQLALAIASSFAGMVLTVLVIDHRRRRAELIITTRTLPPGEVPEPRRNPR